ncbi:MAG: peptide chain release factor N(5)-glutamine methyltransferase, partial [Actinomycetota bacterium]
LRGRVDLVVSNPPYVPDGAELPADVMSEPRVALRAGPSGDEVLLRLCAQVRLWLGDGGAMAFEIGTPEQAATVSDALSGLAETGIRRDLAGRPRVVWSRS